MHPPRGAGFKVQDLGFAVGGRGFRIPRQGLGFRVEGSTLSVQG